jgi:hypothetical protein
MKNCTAPVESNLMTLTEEETTALDWSSHPNPHFFCAEGADEPLDPSDEDLYDEDED